MAETDLKQAAPPTVEVAGAGAGSQLKKVELDLDDAPFLQAEEPADAPVPRDADPPATSDAPDAAPGGKR